MKYYVLLLLVGLVFILPTPAMAKGIFEHQDTIVPANQIVDDVVVVGGNATILGTVNDSVILFNGNLELKASAKINGFVLVIGGTITQEPGAVITDEIINFSLDNATQNSLLVGGGMVVGTWLLQLAVSVLFVLLSVLAVVLGKGRTHAFTERARQNPGQLLYVGFFSSLILLALSVLLVITLIGIPILLLLVLVIILAFIIGLAATSILVGKRIRGLESRADWLLTLVGSSILVSFMNVPFIGGILFLGILVFSIGLMGIWGIEKIRRKSVTR